MPPAPRPALLLLLLAVAPAVRAQQYVGEDAALPPPHACQLEAWHGQRASWLQPACHLLPTVELTFGVGLVQEGEEAEGRDLDFALQAKAVFLSVEEHPIGVGLVVAAGLDRLSQLIARGPESLAAYVPVSLAMAERRVHLHLNLGWRFEEGRPELQPAPETGTGPRRHFLTWVTRLDVAPVPFLILTGELFGDAGTVPVYQVGLGIQAIPELLRFTGSYGSAVLGPGEQPGWAVGLLWSPPPLW